MMFDNMELNKLLNQQKRMISKLDTDYKEMKKKKRHNLTVEILEKLWGQEDMIWENVNKSLDEGKRIMKERNSTHQDIDQLINNHEYIKELQHRERKQMLSKINIRNTQQRDKNKEEKGKAANENTSSSLDEDDSGKTKTQQSVEKDATEDLAGLQCNEMTVSQEKIINKSSTEIVQSVAEGDTEQLDAPLEQLTVVDKEVHEDNVSTVTPLTASHENEGVDPPAASVVESAQMKEVSSPISINTESPVQDYQDESKEKAGENMETRKTDEMHSPIPIHSPMDIVSDDQPCSRWIDGMHSPIPIHSPVEILEKLWGQEDMVWENVNRSLDQGKRIMKERNSTHQDIDQLINNHERIKELQHRERKQMLSKINIRNTRQRENKEEKGKAANDNTSSSLDEGAKDDLCKTKTYLSAEKDATKEKIINKSTEKVQSVAESDAELDAPSEQLTVVDKEVHKDNVSTVASKIKRGRPVKLQAKSPETRLTASHENEGVDPSAASVVESAQMKEVSSPISINTESPVQDYQDESKEKAGENMETRKTDEMHSPIPIHSPMDIVSDDQPCSRWIDGMHSPIPIHSPASERRLEENLPFVKCTPLWHTLEAMEAFQKIPQNPHFRPLLKGVKESAREGLAIGAMVTFSTVVDRIYCLRFEDPRSTIEDCLETLVELENNGFNVEVIRDCLTRLLLLKDKQEELEDRSKGVVEKIEEQKIQEKTINDEVDEIDRHIRQVEEKRRKVLLKKEKWNAEVDAMKAAEGAIEQKIIEVAAEFDGLAAAPL